MLHVQIMKSCKVSINKTSLSLARPKQGVNASGARPVAVPLQKLKELFFIGDTHT